MGFLWKPTSECASRISMICQMPGQNGLSFTAARISLGICVLFGIFLIDHVRSLVWGAGWHRYPPDCWKNFVKGFLQEVALVDSIPFTDIDRWFNEGKEFGAATRT